jgi:outer membrane protein TolC
LRAGSGLLVAALLAGCASFSEDGGFGKVQSVAQERLGRNTSWVKSEKDAEAVRQEVKKLLAVPLTPDAAVQIALLNNRGLQATYAELGIAESDLVQAGRLRNPGFLFERLSGGNVVEIERTFFFDLMGLLTMPVRTDLEQRRFDIVQQRVAAELLRVATDTRRAYYRAVAAREGVKYMDQVKLAAETSAELARRMAAAGNFTKLDEAREQVFYAEVTAQLARVRQAEVAQREQLIRMMGLWGEDIAFELPARLPGLPKSTPDFPGLEATALKQRLDVQAAMKEAERIAASMGLVKVTGVVDVLEVGYRRNTVSGEPTITGYEIGLHLPVFDWGGARVARAEFTYMQAVNRAADLAVRARSEVREAYSGYRTAYDLAKHYRDEVVPLRKRISEENLLRYNGMLISIFELLADARQQVAAVNAAIDALRDFWLADASLQLAMTGTSPGTMNLAGGVDAMPAGAGGH